MFLLITPKINHESNVKGISITGIATILKDK